MAAPPLIDLGTLATEAVKFVAFGALTFAAGKLTKWFEGYQKTSSNVLAIQEAVQELTTGVSDFRESVDRRLDGLERRTDDQFREVRDEFKEHGKSVHAWRTETQILVNRQEGRIIRLEERLRTFMIMQVGPERARHLESLMPESPEETGGQERQPHDA
jgi:hypothetical protein